MKLAGRVAALCVAALLVWALALGATADETAPRAFEVVIVDAGHGGSDDGARGPGGSLEKDIVLGVARELAAALREQGLAVVMTRDGDAYVPLEERTHIANDARGDLFVSIHANAARDAKVRGSETFFLSLEASDAAAQSVAERENSAFGAPAKLMPRSDDPLVAILGNLMSSEHLTASQEFARLAQERLAQIAPETSRGVKQAPFVVLDGVQMPAALVEIGFISNLRDERSMRSAAGRRAVVAAVAEAVVEFGRRHDARRGLGAGAMQANR